MADASLTPAEKVRSFPTTPGVYLMKDAQGVVIYIGKAKSLRNRASSYFHSAAAVEQRTAELVKHIADIDYIQTESEVEAILMEARLVKDTQPRFNSDLKDDKSFPYLQIRVREEFPRVEFTRKPRHKGVRLYGPFTSARGLRMAMQVLQRIFQFRTCSLDIKSSENRWRWYRPCILHNIRQCTAPCNFRVTREEYRKQIRSLRLVLEGKKDRLIREMEKEMFAAAEATQFERAARLRDEIDALRKLQMRGSTDPDVQPHVFHINPRKGLKGLQKVLGLPKPPRVIEGMDIAHFQGADTVASLVSFIDGTPFKPGYRRFKIQSVAGVDDFASMREVVFRRFRQVARGGRAISRHLAHRWRQGATERGDRGLSAIGNGTAHGDFIGQARRRNIPARRGRIDQTKPPLVGPAIAAKRPRRIASLRAALSSLVAEEEIEGGVRHERRLKAGDYHEGFHPSLLTAAPSGLPTWRRPQKIP